MAYQAGYNKAAKFYLDGGSNVTLAIRGYSASEEVQSHDTSHSGTSGKRTRIAGMLDNKGTIEAYVDAAALPNATSPGIVAGAKGKVSLDVGSTNVWQFHVLITKVNWRSQVDGVVSYSFDYELDDDGAYTRPS